jgi:uncharacterized protein YrrD
MRTWRATKGTRVLSKSSAEQVGKVDRFVVDVDGRRIAAVQVGRDQVVPWSAVTGLGDDAMIIDDAASVRAPEEGRERRTLGGELDLDGRLVLSDAGDAQGEVEDLEFDEESGEVEALVTGRGRIEGARLLSVGPYCVVVARTDEHG